MDNKVFINDTFTSIINNYLECKDKIDGVEYNSFFVVVLRTLNYIYDELDILNPFYTCNEQLLYSNMMKYGYEKGNLDLFFESLKLYEQMPSKELFIDLEKMLIDMFTCKVKSMLLSEEYIMGFKDLLYSNDSKNSLQISYHFMMTSSSDEIVDYFDKMIKENRKKEVEKEKETLNVDAYQILKYSLEDIEKMDADQIDSVNKEVYNYFNINENAINKKYLLDKAVYNYNNPKPSFATGNGYLNVLFFLGMLTTAIMVVIIVTIIIK